MNQLISSSTQDGMYAGRLLMKDEVIRLIKASNPKPTKAIQRTLELIEGIKIDVHAPDSVR